MLNRGLPNSVARIWSRAGQAALNARFSSWAHWRHQKYASAQDVPASQRLWLGVKRCLVYLPLEVLAAPLPTFSNYGVRLGARLQPLQSPAAIEKTGFLEASEKVTRWLSLSGIQDRSENPDLHGSVHAWFDPTSRDYAFPYPEITGYFMTWALYHCALAENHGEDGEPFREMARQAARWQSSHGMLRGVGGVWNRPPIWVKDHPQKEGPFLYTFDTAMAMTGMVNLYRFTGDEKMLDVAEEMLHFLQEMARPDGFFNARFDVATHRTVDSDRHWSSTAGCWETKLALPLLLYSECKKTRTAEDAARAICDHVLKLQSGEGTFSMDNKSDFVYSHETCYAAEGLAVMGLRTGQPRYLKAALRATQALLSHQLPAGGIPRMMTGLAPQDTESSDVLAQVLRLGALFRARRELGDEDTRKLHALARRIHNYQNRSEIVSEDGGMEYGIDLAGNRKAHLNGWASMFSDQAYAAWGGLVDPIQLFTSGLLV